MFCLPKSVVDGFLQRLKSGVIPPGSGVTYDRLTGTFANRTAINAHLGWHPLNPGSIALAIPEPATLLLLGLGAVLLRKI